MSNQDFTIGADPEFICTDNYNNIVSGGSMSSSFGCDGNGITCEVRPKPSMNPLKLVSNIHDIFLNKVRHDKKYLKYNWYAGPYYKNQPLGGHIHFGTKNKVIVSDACNILDTYLGGTTILLEEKDLSKKRRFNDGYGMKQEFRTQYHGFEYRTPSSWLVSPYVAAAVLCLAKTIVWEILNNKYFNFKIDLFTDDDFSYTRHEIFRDEFKTVWQDIIKMQLYQTYKPYIDLIYFLVTNNLTWTPTIDLKEAWGLVRQNNEDLLDLDIIWSKFQIKKSLKKAS